MSLVMLEDRERAFARKLYNDGTKLAMGTRKMPPLSVGDKVLVQNQTGRAPNKWDKSGVIVECKPHNQVNVMMDGSRKVSLRNRQFVRKIAVPMPGASSGVKPSQFIGFKQDDVGEVQDHGIGDSEMVGDADQGRVPDSLDRNDADGDEGGRVANEVDLQDRVQTENVAGSVADTVVDQQPVVRSRRNRKPNSKYDPAVYDLDSVQLRGIPLSGKKNGWRGVYWPE